MKTKIICMVAVVCFAGSLNAVMVDDFESYALGTNLDGGGGGWSTDAPFNSNLSSPVVGDDTVTYYGPAPLNHETDHEEISGQFLRFDDDNSYASTSETLSKDLGMTLNNAGDYLQTAMYLNQFQSDGVTAGNGTMMLKLQDASGNNLFTVGMAFRQFHSSGGGYTPLRPSYHTWYFLRGTLRDADDDGTVDSFDFDVYNADMTLYTYEYNLPLVGSVTDGVHIQFSAMGSSAKGIGLVDEITATPEPATVVLLTLGSLLLGRRKRLSV